MRSTWHGEQVVVGGVETLERVARGAPGGGLVALRVGAAEDRHLGCRGGWPELGEGAVPEVPMLDRDVGVGLSQLVEECRRDGEGLRALAAGGGGDVQQGGHHLFLCVGVTCGRTQLYQSACARTRPDRVEPCQQTSPTHGARSSKCTRRWCRAWTASCRRPMACH